MQWGFEFYRWIYKSYKISFSNRKRQSKGTSREKSYKSVNTSHWFVFRVVGFKTIAAIEHKMFERKYAAVTF